MATITPFLGLSGSTALTPPSYQGQPGPGPTPNPWRVSGSTVYYDEGAVTLPSTVIGGAKGKGTLNADDLFIDGAPVGSGGGGAPSGPAGGALTGNYPDPELVGGPLSNYALLTDIPTALPPDGPAGGDLDGNYPDPTIKEDVNLAGNPTAIKQPVGTDNSTLATTSFVREAVLTSITTTWRYNGNVVGADPGTGNVNINGTGNNPRTFAMSKVDADGITRNLSPLLPGDSFIATDDPASPPITGYARYDITSAVVDNGTWFSFVANRVDTAGSQTPPPLGTRIRFRAYLNGAGGGGGSSVFVGIAPPGSPEANQLWWNSETGQLSVYYNDGDTSQWVPASPAGGPLSAYVGTAAPVFPVENQLWWNSELGQMFIYYNDGNTLQWVPAASAGGPPSGLAAPTYDTYTATASLAALIPLSNSPPLLSEGSQIFSRSYTANNAAHRVRVIAEIPCATNAGDTVTAALFIDGATNAVKCSRVYGNIGNWLMMIPIRWEGVLSAGPHTFSVRIGGQVGTIFPNGGTTGAYGGAANFATLAIEELNAP